MNRKPSFHTASPCVCARAGLGLACLMLLSLAGACTGAPAPTPTPLPSATPQPSPTPSPTPRPTEPPPDQFRIVGYIQDRAGTADDVQFDKLTHINYAFLVPYEDGSVAPLYSPHKLATIIEESHKRGVKVALSVGGWGYDGQFELIAADPERRAKLISEIQRNVDKYGFDGVDIDWEYPDPGQSSQNFLALMQELDADMHGQGKLLTAAVVASGSLAEGIPDEVFGIVDFLNIMAYDGPGENHSSYEYAEEALDYWLGRGLPRAKAVLGVPFYSRPGEILYRQLVEADSTAAQNDCIEVKGQRVCYNGIPTMQRKTELALQRGGGIMIWAITQDTSDETSLLSAIYDTVQANRPD